MSELGILPSPVPFGKYYLLERVNIGGMAEIFKAKAFGVEGFERLLAVKKILASIAEDESFINMFIDEAKIAGQLNHPNIAQIFDLGKVDGSYFIALEYISGKDLKTIFERARRLGEKVGIPRVCYIIMKGCEGLGHAHHKKDAQGNDLNIVHRDVSPQNLLISYEGESKIIDFGIAKAQGKTSQTQVGILKGKFSYMSPEQVRGLHIDRRSDIFSLGIVLYELLTLERLFLGESDFDTLEKIRKVEMSPPSLYNPHIPKELEDIVLKALAKSPEERYQTSYELADALEQFMRNQGYYYTNKDLASYMKEAFSADIEFENKKIEYYRSLNLRAPVESPPAAVAPAPQARHSGPPMGLSWGEDEHDTQIYSRDSHAPPDESIIESIIDADIIFAEEVQSAARQAAAGAVQGTSQSAKKNTSGHGRVAHDEPPTVEFNRDALSKSLEEFSFDEGSPGPFNVPASSRNNGGPPRPHLPTAKLPSIEPRRDPSLTMPNASVPLAPVGQRPGASHKEGGSSMGVIAVVALLVILASGSLVYVLWPWPAEVNFAPTPADVRILINGTQVFEGATPHTYKIKPGLHTVELISDGHKPYTIKQEFQKGAIYNISTKLEKTAPTAPNPTLLATTSPPDAVLEIGGKRFDSSSPKEIQEFPPGKYTIKLTKTGYQPLSQDLDLGADGAKLNLSLTPNTIALDIQSDPSRASFELFDQESRTPIKSGKTPEQLKELDGSKTYRLVISSSGKRDAEEIIAPSDDLTRKLNLKLEDERAAVATIEQPKPVEKDPPRVRKDPPRVEVKEPVKVVEREPVKVVERDPPPKKDPAPVGVATLTIGSRPAARVFIDGKDTGLYTPLKDYKIPATKHKIELVNEEFNLRKTYYVDLKPGEDKKIINKPD